MNVFVLDLNPRLAAQYHCDQHINKMILESAQILSTAAREHIAPKFWKSFYKPLQVAHPCVQWAIEALENCSWVINLGIHLNQERLHRFPDVKSHKSAEVISLFDEFTGATAYKFNWPTKFALAMPDQFRNGLGTDVEKYQAYYRHKKAIWKREGKEMTWTNREEPEFMK